MMYNALDRHLEAILGARHLYRSRPIGTIFLGGGVSDGVQLEAHRYPPAATVHVPVMSGYVGGPVTMRNDPYQLKTLIWSDEGMEARYEYAPSDAPPAKPRRKSRRK